MSRYSNYDWDSLVWEIEQFLKDNSLADLLEIVTDIARDMEDE